MNQERVRELEAVANGVLWLDNNMHQYGTYEWRGFFKAVVRDARRAVTPLSPRDEGEPAEGTGA